MRVYEKITDCTKNFSKADAYGCVILASGLGTRFGGNKLMAELAHKPIIQWILDTTEDLFGKRIVVTRSEEVERLCQNRNIPVIRHTFPGKNDSVRLGLLQMPKEIKGCMFCQGDQPFISRNTIIELLASADREKNTIWRPKCKETVGAPVVFPSVYFDKLLHLPQGKGGNYVVAEYAEFVRTMEIANAVELYDIDTREEYMQAIKYCSQSAFSI